MQAFTALLDHFFLREAIPLRTKLMMVVRPQPLTELLLTHYDIILCYLCSSVGPLQLFHPRGPFLRAQLAREMVDRPGRSLSR